MDPELHELAERVGAALHSRKLELATAESCTGGWVAKTITDIPGSSGWFDRGFITYSNAAKQDLLGVDESVLEEFGAVSEPTVAAMVRGALAHSRADLAVAVSGIAGPGGGRPGKPVGTVCIGAGRRQGEIVTLTECFPGDREAVRRQSVLRVLTGVLDLLND